MNEHTAHETIFKNFNKVFFQYTSVKRSCSKALEKKSSNAELGMQYNILSITIQYRIKIKNSASSTILHYNTGDHICHITV